MAFRPAVGLVALIVLASCFHGRPPSVTLAPRGPDALAARKQGPFAVVHAAPKGHVADRKQPGVTVMFSRGVRSIEMGDDAQLPAIAIKTKSGGAVKGAWRWTGTRGLLFSPDGELPGGNDYVVTVPPDIRALDGSVLGKPYVLELSTDGPSLTSFRVSGAAGVTEHSLPTDPSFHLQFDQEVDPAAVAAATSLHVFERDGDKGTAMKVVATRDPETLDPTIPPSWLVRLKPERPLPANHQVELTIAKSLHGTGGPREMENPITRTMRTHGPLRFVDFYCPRLEAKGRCRQGGDVKVSLSNPVSPAELKAHLKTDKLPPRPPPKPGQKAPIRKIDTSTEHWLGVAPKLGEKYRVTLTAGMKDVFGQKLEKDAFFDLVVEAPLVAPAAPAVALADPEPAPTPKKPPLPAADVRPRRERLPYRLDVGLSGQVLEANVPGGHKVPVGAINIPTYASLAAPLTEAQATSWMLTRGSDFISRNGFATTWVTNTAAQNERSVDFLDLDAILAPKKGRGSALVFVSPPSAATTGGAGRTESFVTVTDIGVSAKMSAFGSLVWVTSLATGKPLTGATVIVRTTKGGDVFTGTSDASGLVVVPTDRFDPMKVEGGAPQPSSYDDASEERVRADAALVVKNGDDWTIQKIGRSGIESRLTSDFSSLAKEGHWAGMVFADRGVFRPGETAKVAGIVRVVEGDALRSVAGRELRIELKDHNGEQIFDGRAKCDDFGTFALDMPIPKSAEVGLAQVTATALPGGKSNTTHAAVFSSPIRILEFKPNEFKVVAEAGKPFYIRGDEASFTTQGDYLYGAPMAGADIVTTVTRQEVPFSPPGADAFTISDDIFTGDYADETKAAAEVESEDGKLDAKGGFARKVKLAFDDQRRPERVVFDAEVADISRSTVSARTSVMVHPGEFYVGLKTPPDRFVAAGAPYRADVAAIDPTGTHRANVKVKVELVERRWSSVTGEQPDGRAARSSKPVDTIVGACEAVTTATPTKTATCNIPVPHAGFFIVRATASDPRGNTVRASASVYGTETSATAQTAWAADDRHGIKLEPNKKRYDVGETAKVLLRSPFKEGNALVTVERNGVLFRKVIPISGAVPVVEVPIAASFYPNAFVSVVALRGRVQAPPKTGTDVGGPDYRYGWTEIVVNEDAHRLHVGVKADKAEYHPGTMVEADVEVKDKAGSPVETALTFYVVDEGVLALTSYQTPDPLPSFVQKRKLGVFTFDNRESLAHILPMKAGEKVASLGYEFSIARNPGDSYDKGDDGGDGAGLKRADFRTTAYFESGRKTDKSGKAHFSFKLPDNLTTFRIMAVASAADDRFGSGDSKISTFRKLMARPALPRLLRVGDQVEASVVVSSKLDDKNPDRSPMPVNVAIAVKGLALSGPKSKSITMPRGGQMEVRFPVKATDPGEAVVTFDVASGSDKDQVELKRKVELPVSIEATAVYGEATGDAAIALGDLTQMRKDFGGLDVCVSSSALAGLGLVVDRLNEYPYDCTEQLTSRVLPLVAAFDLAKDAGAKMPPDVNAQIDATLENILKRQGYEGGFGFWEKGNPEPWLSAYAMLAIGGAAERKRFVPRDVLERGHDYLNGALASATRRLAKAPPSEDDTKKPDLADAGAAAQAAAAEKAEKEETQRGIDFVSAALIADSLASLGWPNPGALNVLYDARAGQRLSGLAALLHAMTKSNMPAAQIKALRGEIEMHVRVGPNLAEVEEPDSDRWEPVLDSHIRTQALVLRAFVAADAKDPLAARLARRLLSLRQQDGAWRTTQEDAWALLALADYRRAQETSGPELDVRTLLGSTEMMHTKIPRGSFREDKIFISADTLLAKGPTLSFDMKEGRAFYSAQLKYATAALPTKALDEGLFVAKYVRGVAPSAVKEAMSSIPKKTATEVTAGDLVIVDLVFETAEPRDRIVIADPLPAGLEALDYDLDTTSQAARDAENKKSDPKKPAPTFLGTTFRQAESRRQIHDERVDTFFAHVEPGMYHVRYLARATSVGSFVVPPTRIEAMYVPEVYGRTAATALSVKAKP